MTSKEWQKVKLSTLCKIKGGKRLPKGCNLVQNKTKHPYIRVRDLANIKNLELNSSFEYIEDTIYNKIKNYTVNTGDVIISIVGTIGLVSIIKESLNNANLTENCAKLINLKNINNNFLYYFLSSELGQNEIKKGIVGAVQQKLPLYSIEDISIPLPPLEIQEKIARVLSSLDDKIELNNKINQNLEWQAQAIFKSWFVDFEPFGGKMPEDWEESNLLEIANYLNGLAMQKYRPKNNEPYMPVLKIKELRQGFCDNTSDICTKNINDAYIINNGDIIFSWSGSLLVDIWCGGKCGLNQHLFKVTSEKYNKWFCYLWTKYHLNKFIALASDMATTMGHIKRGELEKSKVIIPNKEDYQKINNIINPILNLIINNKIQNERLAQLRDTLLPKFMSGEIDVDKVEV